MTEQPKPSLLSDLLVLTKPRIVVMILITAGAGFWMATPTSSQVFVLFHLLLGTTLVAGGTNALNQVLERDADALMHRTHNRPLPAGRMSLRTAAIFAWILGVTGIAYLAWQVNVITAALAAATLVSYVFLYTPLKSKSSLATLIGGVPGALPIVGGWTAVTGWFHAEAWLLFWILFLWQLPHFLALGWLYREDYKRAGMRMLSVNDEDGRTTFLQASLYSVALVPASIAPSILGLTGALYFSGALALSVAFVVISVRQWQACSIPGARKLFRYSLLYLPLLLLLMGVDRIP